MFTAENCVHPLPLLHLSKSYKCFCQCGWQAYVGESNRGALLRGNQFLSKNCPVQLRAVSLQTPWPSSQWNPKKSSLTVSGFNFIYVRNGKARIWVSSLSSACQTYPCGVNDWAIWPLQPRNMRTEMLSILEHVLNRHWLRQQALVHPQGLHVKDKM